MRTALGDQARIMQQLAHKSIDGLTDDELHWEPAPGMWGLRLKTELHTPMPDDVSPGDWWLDGVRPRPDPEPFTTIGWRMAHMILGTFNWNAIIRGEKVPPEPSLPGDAAGNVALWHEVIDHFVDQAVGFTSDELAEEVKAWNGDVRRSFLVSHVTLEVSYHASEVGCLRHLHRAMHGH